MRKKLFYVLIAVFVLQLIVPACMIVYSLSSQRSIETYGKEYNVKIIPYDVASDGEILFNPRYCSISFSSYADTRSGVSYIQLGEFADGTAYAESISHDKPDSPYYIRGEKNSYSWSFPIISYPADKDTADKMKTYIEKHHLGWLSEPAYGQDIITLRIYVYKGKMITEGIYINGIPMEEFFAETDT